MRVQGLASSVPLERNDPNAPTNRRISIIVMNREAEDRLFGIEPDAPAAENTAEKAPQVTETLPEAPPPASTASSTP